MISATCSSWAVWLRDGGQIIIDKAEEVLRPEFPELKIQLRVPDEKTKRHGQAVAAASLPALS